MEKYINAHSFPVAKRNAGWKIQPSKTTKPEKNQSVEDVGKKDGKMWNEGESCV